MTVCIAAKADNGKALILAADQLATNLVLGRKIEGNNKILSLTGSAYLLISGDDLACREIYKRAIERIGADSSLSTLKCAEIVRECFSQFRFDLVEGLYLKSRGYDRVTYQIAQQAFNKDIAKAIDDSIQNHAIDPVLIVAGIDPDETTHIHLVSNPGIFVGEFQDFSTCGSGYSHAYNSLHARGYKIEMPIDESAYYVYEAKKNSEEAQGVGEETTLLVITKGGSKTVTKTNLSKFDDIFKKVNAENKKTIEDAVKSIKLEPTN